MLLFDSCLHINLTTSAAVTLSYSYNFLFLSNYYIVSASAYEVYIFLILNRIFELVFISHFLAINPIYNQIKINKAIVKSVIVLLFSFRSLVFIPVFFFVQGCRVRIAKLLVSKSHSLS